MTQHDYDIADAAGAVFRADLNNVLAAIVSQNSGATAPTTTFAHQLWYDTTTSRLKKRDGSNAAWIEIFEFNDGGGTVTFLGGLDIGSLTEGTVIDVADMLAFYDDSAGSTKKISVANFWTSINVLTTLATPDVADLLALYDTSGALTGAMTLANIWKSINGLTELPSPDTAADFIPIYDASAGAIRKIKPENLGITGSATQIATGSLSGASLAITNIPETYTALILVIDGYSGNATDTLLCRASVNNGSSYDGAAANYKGWYNDNAGGDGYQEYASFFDDATSTSAATGDRILIIESYQSGPSYALWRAYNSGDNVNARQGLYAKGTNNIDALQLSFAGSAIFDAGTYTLYGVR